MHEVPRLEDSNRLAAGVVVLDDRTMDGCGFGLSLYIDLYILVCASSNYNVNLGVSCKLCFLMSLSYVVFGHISMLSWFSTSDIWPAGQNEH